MNEQLFTRKCRKDSEGKRKSEREREETQGGLGCAFISPALYYNVDTGNTST